MRRPDLVRRASGLQGDLEGLREHLDRGPEAVFGPVRRRSRETAAIIVVPGDEEVVSTAGTALDKVRRHGESADFTDREAGSFEAVVEVVGRPAILVEGGTFVDPPPEWTKLLEHRATIDRAIAGVGRIEVSDGAQTKEVGTGFLVSPGVVATNRHVLEQLAAGAGREWTITEGLTAQVDFAEEHKGLTPPAEFPVVEVVGSHEREDVDLAFLRLAGTSVQGKPLPEPLPLAAAPRYRKGRDVYVIGYPTPDPQHNDVFAMQAVFDDLYYVKRLQPGGVTSTKRKVFAHDCSTLAGNSGSCVVDLRSGEVVGIHYHGQFRVANFALKLWQLRDDPLVREAGVAFPE